MTKMAGAGGLSKSRLSRMHDVMAGKVAEGEMPGLVTLVSRGGETHVDTIGNIAFDGTPMQRDTIFRISSMSKPVIAVAAMILVEECRLRLDDPVDRWLPEFADREVLRAIDADIGDTVPALSDGLKGRAAGVLAQGVPFGPELIAKLEEGLASGVPGELQGTRSLVVSKPPQVVGVANGARGPCLKSTSNRLAALAAAS